MKRTLLVLALALSVAACGAAGSRQPAAPIPPEINGTVRYLQGSAIPLEAQLRVRLEEVSRADAPAQFIAETTVPRAGPVPIPFRISVDPRVIDPKRGYTLTARIERQERLLFINEAPVRVLTLGYPSRVEIVVVPATDRK
jgi:putative lipoprotein